MTTMQTSNFIPELDRYLDAKANGPDTALAVTCQVCRKRKLTISALAQSFMLIEERSTGCGEPLDQLVNLYVHGFEQTVVFPCGHVFGDRCVREKYVDQRELTCPSCEFQMTYTSYGHAIIPAIIPMRGIDSIRDTFPLTIPEGGQAPRHCKECRWKAIKAKIRYALNSECVIYVQKAGARVPQDPIEHDVHRIRHIKYGAKEVISRVMMLVQPEFITRETETSAQRAVEEGDRQNVNTAVLNAMVLTELEGTIWHRTATKQLTKEQVRRHALGLRVIESCIFGLLMDAGNNCRRMW
ncbi:hypothetical protein HD806DRAFT_32403 [Xylariaceae sp. AK1471]|nr:hypothetical protein HD806DRAFT_32403 [Xylariaceae sp. AK1471]